MTSCMLFTATYSTYMQLSLQMFNVAVTLNPLNMNCINRLTSISEDNGVIF